MSEITNELQVKLTKIEEKYHNCGFMQYDYSREMMDRGRLVLPNAKQPLYAVENTCGIHINFCRRCKRRLQTSMKRKLLLKELEVRKEYENTC